MTIEKTRSSAASLTVLRRKVLMMCADADGDRFAPGDDYTQVDDALGWSFKDAYALLSIDSGVYHLSTDLTYAASSDSTALSSASPDPFGSPITEVYDITVSDRPVLLTRVGSHDLERWQDSSFSGRKRKKYVWCLLDDDIAVRPRPVTGLTLRLWYIGNPYTVPATASNQHPLPDLIEELIVLTAALTLLSINNESAPLLVSRQDRLREDFRQWASLYRGSKRVKRIRKYH